jgi:hypothetical protein
MTSPNLGTKKLPLTVVTNHQPKKLEMYDPRRAKTHPPNRYSAAGAWHDLLSVPTANKSIAVALPSLYRKGSSIPLVLQLFDLVVPGPVGVLSDKG